MEMRLVFLCPLLLGQLAWTQPLVIKRVTVIDATGKPAQPDMTVVIAGDHIAAVSPWKKAKIPKGAQVVDGTAKFLIPGLWDMHVHGAVDSRAIWSYPLYLAKRCCRRACDEGTGRRQCVGSGRMWAMPIIRRWFTITRRRGNATDRRSF